MNGTPIAAPGARPTDRMLAALMDWYLGTKRTSDHYGTHWDRFRPDFERLIATDALWQSYRANGLTIGFDDNNFHALGVRERGRVRPDVLPYAPDFKGNLVPLLTFDAESLVRDAEVVVRHLARTGRMESILDLHDRTIAGDPPLVRLPSLGRTVDLNTLQLLWFADDIMSHVAKPPSVILEIGGGYGGLAAAIHRIWPMARIVIVDLPEVLAVQVVHLQRLFPDSRLRLLGNDTSLLTTADTDFTLVPAHATDRLANAIDLAINIRSFMEMPQDIANGYVRLIQHLTEAGGTLYLANRLEKRPVWAGSRQGSTAPSKQHTGEEMFRMPDLPLDK